MKKPWKMIKASASSAEIMLYEQIGKDYWTDEGIAAKDFVADLKALGDVAEIVLRIASPGGSVFEGLVVYNSLVMHPAKKTVCIDGVAASMAAYIALCGDKIVMPENAMMMFHGAHSIAEGTAKDLREMADLLDKTNTSLRSILAKRCNSEAQIDAMLNSDTWLTAQECKGLGLCDEVTGEAKMAASVDLSKFKNVPPALSEALRAAAQAAGGATPAAHAGVPPQAPQPSTPAASTTTPKGEQRTMNKCKHCGAELAAGASCSCQNAVTARMAEVNEVLAMAEKHGALPLAKKFLAEGKGKEEFVCALLESKGAQPVVGTADIGMTAKEIKRFSLLRAINAMANPQDKGLRDAAGLEFEASQAVAAQLKKTPQGFFLPMDVMGATQDYSSIRADLTKAAPTGGGNLVSTDLLFTSFIELLRNAMMVRNMGARVLDGLVGDIAIPSQSGGATAYWVTEGNAPTESQQTFGQVTMTPHTVGAFTDISRKLIRQSSIGVENLVRMDLATVIALAIDLASINGTASSDEPEGILQVSGIGDVAGGTNGAAPTWANIVALWTAVAQDNAAIGSLGFLTNSKVVGKLMSTAKVASTDSRMIIESFPDASGMTNLAGARCGVSNQVPSTLTKNASGAVCSAIIYGNWADLIIGQWGALDVLVDPYTGGAAGTVRVRVLQDVDVAVRHAESFAAMKDALTT